MMQNRSGLARITSTPPDPGYHAGQFLGAPPPTVPAVLDRSLFSPAHGVVPGPADSSGAQSVTPPRSAR
ncbi:hypothetical protein ACTXJ8_06505 [Corynebacterium variabile]|uniref:hypothetical protein n=1 Tax=Corynebacterium variabile TaxID=1727 RepID=UPI003FD65D52